MEIFDPAKELVEVKKISDRAEKKEALAEYKEKLAYQKEGLAKLQEELIGEIEKNPDLPPAYFYIATKSYAEEYGFSPAQEQEIATVIGLYEKRHSAVQAIRSEFSDDVRLFEFLFGQQPKGKIEAITGPVTFYFRCYNLEDYVLIASEQKPISAEQLKKISKDAGCKINSSRIPALEGALLAENAAVFPHEDSKKIQLHEEQHAIKEFFLEPPYVSRKDVERVEKLRASNDPQEKKYGLEVYFRSWRTNGEEDIKDELLAYLKEGRLGSEVFQLLTTPEAKGGAYDYFSDIKKDTTETLIKKIGPEWAELARNTAEEIFVKEYQNIIRGAISAYQLLRTVGGYSHEAVIAMLISEPLAKWDKVARRMLEGRKKI